MDWKVDGNVRCFVNSEFILPLRCFDMCNSHYHYHLVLIELQVVLSRGRLAVLLELSPLPLESTATLELVL